jgi:hypothetical protein
MNDTYARVQLLWVHPIWMQKWFRFLYRFPMYDYFGPLVGLVHESSGRTCIVYIKSQSQYPYGARLNYTILGQCVITAYLGKSILFDRSRTRIRVNPWCRCLGEDIRLQKRLTIISRRTSPVIVHRVGSQNGSSSPAECAHQYWTLNVLSSRMLSSIFRDLQYNARKVCVLNIARTHLMRTLRSITNP